MDAGSFDTKRYLDTISLIVGSDNYSRGDECSSCLDYILLNLMCFSFYSGVSRNE